MTLLFPLDYLKLENAWGKLVIRRDIVAWIIVSVLLSTPFIAFDGMNFFHKDGFLDKIGTFSSVLTGFYVAALIAVATLSSNFANLDSKIETGVIRRPSEFESESPEDLTRREYVCLMFGYLAFVSLVLTGASLIIVALSPVVHPFSIRLQVHSYYSIWDYRWVRALVILTASVPISSLAITTVRGLYYLVERLYYVEPQVDQTKEL
jgi:hypothetical protein